MPGSSSSKKPKRQPYLIEVFESDYRIGTLVGLGMKEALELAAMFGQLADPNRKYKTALQRVARTGFCNVFDRQRFGSEHEAVHSPTGGFVRLSPTRIFKRPEQARGLSFRSSPDG